MEQKVRLKSRLRREVEVIRRPDAPGKVFPFLRFFLSFFFLFSFFFFFSSFLFLLFLSFVDSQRENKTLFSPRDENELWKSSRIQELPARVVPPRAVAVILNFFMIFSVFFAKTLRFFLVFWAFLELRVKNSQNTKKKRSVLAKNTCRNFTQSRNTGEKKLRIRMS